VERALDLVAGCLHLRERLGRAALGALAGEERLEPEPERLDLLELRHVERRDPRPPPPQADDEPLALEAPQGVPDGSEADVEPRGELLEAQPLPRRELEPPDLPPQRAVDAVLDGRGGERGGEHGRHF
jgi:hypothetical protein